jgi:hypothetical protein
VVGLEYRAASVRLSEVRDHAQLVTLSGAKSQVHAGYDKDMYECLVRLRDDNGIFIRGEITALRKREQAYKPASLR